MTENPFDPTFEALPATLPVFPLSGVLLLPGGRLPLNIFEPRYLAMVADALASDRLIGMVQPNDEEGEPGGAEIYEIGCAGRIVSFSETDDGRYLVTLRGLIRFRVGRELPLRRGYRRVEAFFEEFRDDLLPGIGTIERDRLLSVLRLYFEQNQIEADWEAIKETPDERLVTSLAMICPFEAREKQALLEAPGLVERAQTMTAILEMAVLEGDGDPAQH
jgi:Lon protease-like protein